MQRAMHFVRQYACHNNNGVSRVFRVLLYHTQTIAHSARWLNKNSIDNLYDRISRSGHPSISMKSVLNQWLEEGKQVKKQELLQIIKRLRKFGRYTQALQVSEWMSEQQNHGFTTSDISDIAIRLDLLSKVHGVVSAEEYFNSIPGNLKSLEVYGALLNCYAHNNLTEQAKAVFQRMKDWGFVKKSLCYNVMLSLYYKMRKHEKLDSLMQEMKENGIDYDNYTYNIRLNAYAAASDVAGMDRILMEMEANPFINISWNGYAAAAAGYQRAGENDKASAMLKKSENIVSEPSRKKSYEIFLTLYASLGKKDEVYRIWNLSKMMRKPYNSVYLSMISSLVKLNDVDGAENIFKEWESRNSFFDIRIPNLLLSVYCRRGLLEKAEELVQRLIESGKEPDAATWYHLATGFQRHGHLEKAVEAIKKATSISTRPNFKPIHFTLAACLKYLKEKGDMEVAEEIFKSLREKQHFSTESYERVNNYIRDIEPGSLPLDDDHDQDKERHVLLELNKDNSSLT